MAEGIKLPSASATQDGLLTTGAQIIAGVKNLTGKVRIGDSSTAVKALDVVASGSSDGIRIQASSGEFMGLLIRGNTLDIISNSADTGAAGDIRFNIGGETSTKGMVSRDGHWVWGSATAGQYLNIDHVMNGRMNMYLPSVNGRMDWNSDATTGVIEYIRFRRNDGTKLGDISINAGTPAVQYNSVSDGRLKTNLQDFNATEIVQSMHPVKFEWISTPGSISYGFIAQELNVVLPQAVTPGQASKDETEEQALWSVDYSKITGVLTKALQEALTKIGELETRIVALEG